MTLTTDDIWPRNEECRYRLYAVRGEEMEVLAASETMGGIGLAILTIHEDCQVVGMRLADLGAIGVLDSIEREWILLPWQRSGEADGARAGIRGLRPDDSGDRLDLRLHRRDDETRGEA